MSLAVGAAKELQEGQRWGESSPVAKLVLLQTGLEQGLFSHAEIQEGEAGSCPQPSAFEVSLQLPCRCAGQIPVALCRPVTRCGCWGGGDQGSSLWGFKSCCRGVRKAARDDSR